MNIEELEAAWNAQSDRFNQWEELGLDEIIAFAQQMERESCAKLCEERGERNRIAAGLPNGDRDEFYCADDIRQRTK